MISNAKTMISKDLNDPALSDPARVICRRHARELLSELPENGHAPIHGGKLLAGDFMGRRTVFCWHLGQRHQIGDILEAESKVPGMSEKGEPFQSGFIITPLSACCSGGRRDQTALFVKAHRCHLDVGPARYLPD